MATPYTVEQSALLYAAQKFIERSLEKNGSDLPPGFYFDVSNQSLTIKFPKGTVVQREEGANKDGTVEKKAVQNLYGYATWALMVDRLRRFHQWNVLRAIILDVIKDVLRRPSKNVRDEIAKEYPQTVALMEELQNQLPIPSRTEQTPRVCKDPGLPATFTFNQPKRKVG